MKFTLTASNMGQGARQVAARDRLLAGVYRRLGPPPPWLRRPGLETLLHIILEQQVSLAAGRAAMQRLRACCGGRITAGRVCRLGPVRLRGQARLTRQKSEFVHAVAVACQQRCLNMQMLSRSCDDEVRRRLVAIRGVGPWTASIYLLNALGRPDVLPAGDLALAAELQHLCGLAERPGDAWIEQRVEIWRPWRSVAVRMIWHSYLVRHGRHAEITE